MDIKIKTDLKDIQRKLNILKTKTFLNVLKESMNQTGKVVVNAHRFTLLKKLHRPKKSTLTSIKISQYAKANLSRLKTTVSVAKGSTNALYYMFTGDTEPARHSSYPSPTRDGKPKANKFGNIVTKSGIIKKLANNKSNNKTGSVFFGVPGRASCRGRV